MHVVTIRNHNDFDSHTEVPVAEGKLVLVECDQTDSILYGEDKPWGLTKDINVDPIGLTFWKPIIISETEKIEVGDWILTQENEFKQIHRIDKSEDKLQLPYWLYTTDCHFHHCGRNVKTCKKVLALPEHFSLKHLQAIVDGKMKGGDKVLVECEYNRGNYSHHSQDLMKVAVYKNDYWFIKLNPSNYITLHKMEQGMYTEEQVIEIVQESLRHFMKPPLLTEIVKWFDSRKEQR